MSILAVLILASVIATGAAQPGVRKDLFSLGIWDLIVRFFEWFGRMGQFCRDVATSIFTRPVEGREFLRQLDSIGSKSLPLVALAGAATGAVLSMQTHDSLSRFGAKSMLPAVIFYSLIKETGPIITGLVVSGRVGAGIGAELGS